jgi:hypothetical protein
MRLNVIAVDVFTSRNLAVTPLAVIVDTAH